MDNKEKSSKLAEILADSVKMEKIANAETKEVMQALFRDSGLELTMSEIDAFIQMMNSDDEIEISEENLESVSGGASGVDAIWIFTQAYKGVKAVAKYSWNAGRWVAKYI